MRGLSARLLVAAALLGLLAATVTGLAPAVVAADPPTSYAVEFVSAAARNAVMNDRGVIAGVRLTLLPGCTPATCAPTPELVVWSGGTVIPLPLLPGWSSITAVGINASGWVAGYAGDPTSTGARAVVWKPMGASYTAIDLGVLPGTTSSWAAGIDDSGRAVGWSTTGGAFPTATAPFVWSEATGLVDLTAQGFPNDMPQAVSPGGTVATPAYWYRLDDPSSVTRLASPPPGFTGPGNYPAAINDAGDQVRFLISTGAQFLPYLFRYHNAGTWQQIWFSPAGHLAPYGVGSINGAGDLTATVGGVGLVAYGPSGLAEPLAARLSLAYGGAAVTRGGSITSSGEILSGMVIGRAARLVRLLPATSCANDCIRIVSIQMEGTFIPDPSDPDGCTPLAANHVVATLTVKSEGKNFRNIPYLPLRDVTVTGRFLDDYYLDAPFIGTTDARGMLKFVHDGPACVGAIAFFVDDATRTGLVLDRTIGRLTNYVIPLP